MNTKNFINRWLRDVIKEDRTGFEIPVKANEGAPVRWSAVITTSGVHTYIFFGMTHSFEEDIRKCLKRMCHSVETSKRTDESKVLFFRGLQKIIRNAKDLATNADLNEQQKSGRDTTANVVHRILVSVSELYNKSMGSKGSCRIRGTPPAELRLNTGESNGDAIRSFTKVLEDQASRLRKVTGKSEWAFYHP